LYGCERKEYSLIVFENQVLKRIFGAKRQEITQGWKKIP
jgi:hypothetical protein